MFHRNITIAIAKKISAAPNFGEGQLKVIHHRTTVVRVYAVASVAAVHFSLYDASLFHGFEVLRYCGLREGQCLHQISAHTAASLHQRFQYGDAGRVAQCLSKTSHLIVETGKKLILGFTHIAILR